MNKSIPIGEHINCDSKYVLNFLLRIDLNSLFLASVNKMTPLKRWKINAWLKLEESNKTGSFKDRAMKLIGKDIIKRKKNKINLITSGNAGLSLIEYLQDNNSTLTIEAENKAIFNNVDFANLNIKSIQNNKNLMLRIIDFLAASLGVWDKAWCFANKSAFKKLIMQGYYLAQPSIFVNVLGVIGYSAISFEIFNQLQRVPDVVITPVINSDNAIGQWLGYYWLKKKGKSVKIPKFILTERKKKLRHFNYPDAWKTINKISDVQLLSIDDAQVDITREKMLTNNFDFDPISTQTMVAFDYLKDKGDLKNNDFVVLIVSGKNRNYAK